MSDLAQKLMKVFETLKKVFPEFRADSCFPIDFYFIDVLLQLQPSPPGGY